MLKKTIDHRKHISGRAVIVWPDLDEAKNGRFSLLF